MKNTYLQKITAGILTLVLAGSAMAQTGNPSAVAIASGFASTIEKDAPLPGASLPYSTPEAEGISSTAILNFLKAVDNGKNELHSFVIVRHGKIVSEGWWDPYGKDLRHVMFSVSKSFTSTGVGLAIAENKLNLSDRVTSFFPQSLPDTLSEYMKEMTVEHLLMMSTGMNTDPMFAARGTKDWPRAFLSAPVEHKPGSVFKYNNMATFMLSAIVQKATGQKLFDYLKPRLLEPLGIKNVTWDETPEGYTMGAIGLRIQSEDMAKFGQLLLQKGKWNGKELVPASWIDQATSFKINSNDPGNKNPKDQNDWEQGYCYQFWRCRNNGFRADGMGGQFVIVLPEKDAVVVLTCSAANTQDELNLVWEHLLPAMQEKALPANKTALAELNKRLTKLTTAKQPASNMSNEKLQKRIAGKEIRFAQNDNGLQSLILTISNNKAQLELMRGSDRHTLTGGKDAWVINQTKLSSLAATPRPNQNTPVKVASKYSWTDASTIEWSSKFVEESIGTETWTLHFEEDGNDIRVLVEIKGMQPRKLEGKITN